MQGFFKWAGIILLSLVLFTGLVWFTGLLWPRLHNTVTAGAASAMGTLYGAGFGLLSAVASAIAAIAAYKAAKQSDETAKRAGEALGLAMEPIVSAHIRRATLHEGANPPREAVYAVVRNESRWPASNVRVYDADRRSNPLVRVERLEGVRQWNTTVEPKPVRVEHELPRSVNHDKPEFGKLLIVEYSDERGILTWRKTIGTGDVWHVDLERVR